MRVIERRIAYEKLASSQNSDVDFVVLGCPHYSMEQLWKACRILEGKHVHVNTSTKLR